MAERRRRGVMRSIVTNVSNFACSLKHRKRTGSLNKTHLRRKCTYTTCEVKVSHMDEYCQSHACGFKDCQQPKLESEGLENQFCETRAQQLASTISGINLTLRQIPAAGLIAATPFVSFGCPTCQSPAIHMNVSKKAVGTWLTFLREGSATCCMHA